MQVYPVLRTYLPCPVITNPVIIILQWTHNLVCTVLFLHVAIANFCAIICFIPMLPHRVTVGPRLSQLLDGLLEPVAEDRLTAQEALDILDGRAQRQQRQQQQQRRQERQLDTRTGRYGR